MPLLRCAPHFRDPARRESSGLGRVETIRQLAGHVSEKTLARHAHIRVQGRRDAIATLEREREPQSPFQILRSGHKNWAQSGSEHGGLTSRENSKVLENKGFSVGRGGRI